MCYYSLVLFFARKEYYMQKKYFKSLFSKGIALLMICFIVFQTFGAAPALALSPSAELTKIEAWVTPINGTKNMVYSTASPADAVTINQAIDQDSTFSIRFDFNAPSDLSGALNDLRLPLPYEFAAEELIKKMQLENKPHYTAPNGYFTYTYHVDTASQRKYIQVRFDKDVLTQNNGVSAECFIEASARFSLDQSATDNLINITIENNLAADNTFSLRFHPNNIKSNVNKEGKFYSSVNEDLFNNATKFINPHEIKWTVDINKTLESIPANQAVVVDEFDATKMKYKNGSLKIYPLSINLHGDMTVYSTPLSPSDYDIQESTVGNINKITITLQGNALQNGSMNKAYRLEYITDIDAAVVGSNIYLKNRAHFQGVDTPVEKSLKIDRKMKDETKKSATHLVDYDGTGQTTWLRWSIIANKSERNILRIKDTLPAGLTLIKYGDSNPYNQNNAHHDGIDIYEKFLVRKIKSESLHKENWVEDEQNPANSDYVRYTADQLRNLFDITLSGGEIIFTPKSGQKINDALLIVYDTKYSIKPSGSQAISSYQNTVTLETTPGLNTTAGNFTSTSQSGVLQGEISKALDDNPARNRETGLGYYIDYVNSEIRWRINIDPKAGLMKELTITDTFPNDGLLLLPYRKGGTEKIVVMEGNTTLRKRVGAETNYDYTLTNDGRDGFQITFKKELQNVTTILYRTKFDRSTHRYRDSDSKVPDTTNYTSRDERDLFRNKIVSNWKDVNNTPKRDEKNTAVFAAHPYVKDNGGKNYSTLSVKENGVTVNKTVDPRTRQIEWVIYTNFNAEPNMVSNIVDTIGAGQKLVQDSFEVRRYTVNSQNGRPQTAKEMRANASSLVQAGSDYVVQDQQEDSFQLEIKATNQRYAVIYKTELTDTLSVAEYKNTATLNGKALVSSLKFNDHKAYLNKTGKQRVVTEGKTWLIDWEININKSMSYSDNVVVADKLSADQEYLMDSFVLETYSRAELTGANELSYQTVPNADFKLEFLPYNEQTKTQGFTLTFTKPINREYRLRYASLVTNRKAPFQPTNEVTVNGSHFNTLNNPKRTAVKFVFADTNAGAQSQMRTIKIIKKHGVTNAPLSGIHFELHKDDQLYRSFAPTNASGISEMIKVPFGTYTLKEILPQNSPFTVPQNQMITLAPNQGNVELTILNYPKGSIQVEKVLKSDQTKKIPNIRFELWKKNPLTKVHDFTATNLQGKTDIKGDLDFGNYILKELPSGQYKPIDDMEIIVDAQHLNQILTVENEEAGVLIPYVPENNTPEKPGEKPEGEQPKETPSPDTPKDETPKNETPKDETPKDETPKEDNDSSSERPTPEKPNTPNPSTDIPSIEGEINIPDNSIPLIGRDPNHGIVTFEGNRWTYTPNKGFHGKDTFTVIVKTPSGEEIEEIIEVDVPIPQGITTLPQTDGLPPMLYFLFGTFFIVVAFSLKKRF